MKRDRKPLIRLAYADDDILVRRSISEFILSLGSYAVDIEANNGDELIRKIERTNFVPDICLLDINMPVKNGYDTLKEMKDKWPSIKFLIITTHKSDYSILQMMKNGAHGFILKNSTTDVLKKALVSIVQSNYYYSGLLSNCVYGALTGDEKIAPKINEKERQFLSHCCDDSNYKEIAVKMGLSARTVEGYRDSLFNKLKIKTRAGLIKYAIQTGLASL